MEYGIRQTVIGEIIDLARKYKLDKVILFGSRARGDYKRTSDIDLATKGGDYVRFSLDVDDTTSTLLKYDVVSLDEPVSAELRESIMKEGVVLYEKS